MKANYPDAKIGINKNLLPLYNVGTYYMRDGQEFEIFLLNQTQDVYMAKIKVNGNYISDNGLVLRPGQSIWLDCNWDDKSKFKFGTYMVDDSKATQDAIADNGLIRVEFYKEKKIWNFSNIYIGHNTGYMYQLPNVYDNEYMRSTFTCSMDSMDFMEDSNMIQNAQPESMKETGRIERGGQSNQHFNMVNMNFNSWTSHVQEYKILPESAKQTVEINELRKYCSECGKKLRKSDKFCSKCGTRV